MFETIVSTCGTSIVTNHAEDYVRRLLNTYTNKKINEIPNDDLRQINLHVQERKTRILSASPNDVKLLSAELNGIITYYNGILPVKSSNNHIFIQSDTYIGECCTVIISEWMTSQQLNCSIKCIPGMNTYSLDDFNGAMIELADWCSSGEFVRNPPHNRVVFNLTGGFKSVNGYMQTLGMLYADEIIYIFEGAGLLRIPRLPLDFEISAHKVIADNFINFRKMSIGINLPLSDCSHIHESLLLILEDKCSLSVWGETFWKTYKEKAYREKFLPMLASPRIILGPKFEQSIKKFADSEGKNYSINERMDDLAKYLNSNCQYSPKRLDVKKMKTRKDISTHELDAWSDYDAKRVFFHIDGDKYILDEIDKNRD
jgi:putative CRISPR-associated protein (TIGR02619 family)